MTVKPTASSAIGDVLWTTMETGGEIRGRGAVRDHIVALHTTLFDARPLFRRTVASDNIALPEGDFVGRHIREIGGVAPTGREVKVPYCVVYDISGKQISALRAYFPIAAPLQQLTANQGVPGLNGLTPPESPPTAPSDRETEC